MYKAILAAVVALGMLSIPATATAKPTSTEQTHTVKKKKKVKKKVKHVRVKKEHNAFLREDAPVTYTSSGEESAGDFWRQEYAKQHPQVVASTQQRKPTREDKRQQVVKTCNWFYCTEAATTVVAEAKKWEGKHAKKNKQELKSLFASTGQGPVDPVHTPWCAAFANAILRREGYDGTDSLMARSFLSWGMRTADPKEGDVVVLKRGRSQWAGHVGFFVGYEWYDGVKYVKVLGGNQNKEVSVAYFPASQVIGYRTASVA